MPGKAGDFILTPAAAHVVAHVAAHIPAMTAVSPTAIAGKGGIDAHFFTEPVRISLVLVLQLPTQRGHFSNQAVDLIRGRIGVGAQGPQGSFLGPELVADRLGFFPYARA